MNKIKNIAFALAIGFLVISCGDDDNTAPVVNITSPAAATTYAVADTIQLMGTVTEDTKLESVVISSDLGINETISTLDSDTSHVVNYSITLDALTAAGSYTMTLTATDEAGNVGTDNVQITVQ